MHSLQVLSFKAALCCVLLNGTWLLQMHLADDQLKPLTSCRIQPTDREPLAASHHCVCADTLFSLWPSGLISVHSIADGSLLASIDLPAYLSFVAAEGDSSVLPSSFCLLQVSSDLSTAVAVSHSNTAVALDLNHYFRMYPEHLLCAPPLCPAPLRPKEPVDQDSLQSCSCSRAALRLPFSMDRSWQTRLTSAYSRARQAAAPSSSSSSTHQPAATSWSMSLPHLRSHLALSSPHRRVPPGVSLVSFSVPESCAPSALSVSEFSALLTFTDAASRQVTVALWDLESGSVSCHPAEGESTPLELCGQRPHRLLLKSVFQVWFSISQQELLSRLMLFSNAATVDAVCHLNTWGRCSIPIHSLQAGLKNRQLDTVDFYLKSKENLLKHGEELHLTLLSSSCTGVQELCTALDLLCSAVRDSSCDAQSRQFSEQLLNITMSFIQTQIRSVLSGSPKQNCTASSCVQILEPYITQLRTYMKKYPWCGSSSTSWSSAGQDRAQAEPDQWEQLSTEEIITQSILNNQMPRAQALLRKRGRLEHQLSALRMEGLRQVFSRLQHRDLQTATTLLVNMSLVEQSTSVSFCSVCCLVGCQVKELSNQGFFSEEEMKSVVFIRQVEKLCSQPPVRCPSAGSSQRLGLMRKEMDGEELVRNLVQQQSADEAGELLRLDWVRNWNQSCQTAVLLSRQQHLGTLSSCDSSVLWHYLTSLHDQNRLVDWIEDKQITGSSHWPEITAELVNQHTACSAYLKENLLDLLASLVGLKLLENFNAVPLRDLSCIVELLIIAHDCFSLTCNMEGIVRVLQTARHLSHSYLAPGDHYGLLVRLLTGMGRYNEMTYIFDLLHQNHRFEMLLRKKSCSLKTALLDYIKRCLPADSEKHNMVALCFSMRREIGENHEMAARTQLKMIESQDWVVTPDLKTSLVKALGLLKDAAESYFKDSCVRQATRCVRTAKLVTLQLHFLNQGSELRLINLQPSELLIAVMALPHCYQVFVVAEAYSYSPDWAEVLFQKVVLRGDFVYLEELKQHCHLSAHHCRLLTYCDDVYSRYKLAYQHSFYDVTKMLLQDAKTSSYLNDRLAS
uniref:Spatacsin C-terminal domain-containing protein n=1 Tax=Oryzias latipes TaxID=8090 RepID=A0A3B3HPT9_ORYLA